MSHQAELEVQVNDLTCLQQAAEQIGMELVLDKTKYKTYSGKESCTHAICVKGNTQAYEIGLFQESDGSYTMKTDFYLGGKGLLAVVGDGACKLNQAYQAAVFEKNLPFGWKMQQPVVQQNQELVLEAVRY